MKATPNLFPYKQFEADVGKGFLGGGPEKAVLRTAWSKLKGQAVVTAAVDYGLRPSSTPAERDAALAKAWEDIYIAFKGYGDNILTGFLLQVWHYVEKKSREELRRVLQEACDKVDRYYEEHSIRRRYLEKYWSAPVRSSPGDFCEPTALPISGRPLRDWAGAEGVEYETYAQVMNEMEIREQARRAQKARAVAGAPKRAAPPAASSTPAGSNVLSFPGAK